MKLDGTSALITGGASGLGEATARRLADRGVKVVIADLNVAAGDQLAGEIGGVMATTDVTSEEQVRAAVDAAVELAPLRAVVACAGIPSMRRTLGRDGSYESAHSLDMFRRVVEVNLVGTFNVVRLAATAMSHNKPDEDGARGAVVMTSSVAASDGQIGQIAYTASKAGIVGMTLGLARDLAVVGVRVNTIAPGLIDTPIYGEGPEAEEFKAKLAADVVFPRRLGHADEYAEMALSLLTNSYVNAEVVRLDAALRMPPR
jgi:NAD(P)-dependent dehydrogenase (short-subunit alcohol dehydrogenase family)